jgi:hypothetical protein
MVALAMLPGGRSHARALTIDDRIEAQRAIEQVYWSHRLWPADNPGPKPSLSAVMPEEALRDKVERGMRAAALLDSYWGRPLRGEDLQAEIDRMVRDTIASVCEAAAWDEIPSRSRVARVDPRRPLWLEPRSRANGDRGDASGNTTPPCPSMSGAQAEGRADRERRGAFPWLTTGSPIPLGGVARHLSPTGAANAPAASDHSGGTARR